MLTALRAQSFPPGCRHLSRDSLPNSSVVRPSRQALSPLESALPQNQLHHFANPIESTLFSRIAPFRTNSVPVTPAYTALTKHLPRNPIRMNTSTKHHVAPPLAPIATNSYRTLYRKPHTTWSYHFSHANPSRPAQPFLTTPRPATAHMPRQTVAQNFSG